MDVATEKVYPTPYVNSAILPLLLLSLASQRHSPKPTKVANKEYDYIIVGGGTAGSVVASRLSELPCVNVLLVEAGKDPPLLTEVPALSKFFRFTDIDWNFKTTPQKHTGEALINKEIPLSVGKVLGGSSVLNSAIFSRGSPQDYDGWAAKGAYGWSFKELLPYFRRLEDNKDPEYLKNGFHSKGGPLTVMRPRYQPEIKKPIFNAARTIGFNVVDPNGLKQTGFYDFQAPIRGGQRCSTAKAYLVPAENRTNLHILPEAFVRKIIIKERDAVGVTYDHDGLTHNAFARREVILSAGAINTAKLLMLSGIGPKKELEKLEIPVWADLPVGENLQDRCAVPLNFAINSSIPTAFEKFVNPNNVEQYIKEKTGVLSSVEFISAVGYVNGKETNDSTSFQLTISEGIPMIPKLQYGLKNEVFSESYGPYVNRPYITCLSQPLIPRSRGFVKLRSTDPLDHPLIDPNYMEHPEDVKDIVEGLKTCRKLVATNAMRKLSPVQFQSVYPRCKQYRKNPDLYLWCLSRQITVSMNNPVGTAKMGDPRDHSTVVDPELRVKYIRRLRVVDASIMPSITSGDTQIPTIMIAEKASDIIKSSVNCEDDMAESEVQESMPIISISPEILRRLPNLAKAPVERRSGSNIALSQLRETLNVLKQKVSTPRRSSEKSEAQLRALTKVLQGYTTNRRREDSSSAALREVLQCLEDINRQLQQQQLQASGIGYADGSGTNAAISELVAALNAESGRNNPRNFNNQQGINGEISTVLTQVVMLLERLKDERDVSATSNSNSLTSENALMNQIATALNSLNGNEQGLPAMDSSTELSQSALLNQILSTASGISDSQSLPQRPILPGETSESNGGGITDILNPTVASVPGIRQIQDLSQAVQNLTNNANRTESMMNEILSAVNGFRNATSQTETPEITTTPIPTTQNPQEQMLSQILSTLNELRQNNQSRPTPDNTTPNTNSVTSGRTPTSSPNGEPSNTQVGNPNDATLRQIFSAINEMRQSISGLRNNSNAAKQDENPTTSQDSTRLLQQILEQQQQQQYAQSVQPVVETVVVHEEPEVIQATPVMQPGPAMLPGMQPGYPMIPPGPQPNPLLDLLQRQRNMQLFSAMSGANYPPGVVPPGLQPGVHQQMMGMHPGLFPNQQLLQQQLMMNRMPHVVQNQTPCQKTVILNNLSLCNGNDMTRRPMTANEAELCRSLHSGTQCQSRSKCGGVSPLLYKYYCGKK